MSGRWYGNDWTNAKKGRVLHADQPVRDVPMAVLRLAGDEYERHYSQSFETVMERGGFSVQEVIALLADRVERLAGRASGVNE